MRNRRSLRTRISGLLVVSMSCGLALVSTSPPASATCPTPPNGAWIGTWASNDGFYSGAIGADYTWSPTQLNGTLSFITGTAALSPNTAVVFSVACNTVTGTVPTYYGPDDVNATISPDGTQLAGTYAIASIPGGVGTFQVSAVTQVVSDTGTSLTTDAAASGATADAPMQTEIASPNPGPLQIEQALVPSSVVSGYSLLTQVVRITAPDATADSPLAFTFELDQSVTSGASAASIAVFRNGILLVDCAGDPGTASPDPCVASRVDLINGNVQIKVLTSHASVWTLGTPARKVSVGSAGVAEGNSGKLRTISFPVTLSEPATTRVDVHYTIRDRGSAVAASGDYRARTGVLHFNPSILTGVTKTSAFITTTVTPDTSEEFDETFAVDLTSSNGGYEVGRSTAIGTILTDDSDPTPSIRVGDASIVEGDLGASNTVKVAVELAEPATAPESVLVTLVPNNATTGADLKLVKPRIITFQLGQWQKFITVSVLPDTGVEADETIDVLLSNPSSGLGIARTSGIFTILNDD